MSLYENNPNVTIFDHVLIQHKVAILRSRKTSVKEFSPLTLVSLLTILHFCKLYTSSYALNQH